MKNIIHVLFYYYYFLIKHYLKGALTEQGAASILLSIVLFSHVSTALLILSLINGNPGDLLSIFPYILMAFMLIITPLFSNKKRSLSIIEKYKTDKKVNSVYVKTLVWFVTITAFIFPFVVLYYSAQSQLD